MDRLEAFFAHWRSIPRAGLVPSLRDYLDVPRPDIQPWTIILDIEAHGLPVRLFGTALTELMGLDGTGHDYTLAVRESRRAQVLARDTLCTTHPCGLRLGMQAVTQKGRAFINTVLVLPVMRGPNSFSIIRVSDVGAFVDELDPVHPLSISHYTQAEWVDIGAGVPPSPPWTKLAAK